MADTFESYYEQSSVGHRVVTDGTNINISGVFPDTGSWIKSLFMVTLGKDFDSYKQILEESLKDELFSTLLEEDLPESYKDMIDDAGASEESVIPAAIMNRKFRDTSLGGNDAINCYYQFNENDDIIHPFMSLGDDSGKRGLGRVYSENIDDNQQIMYMTFGVPEFSGITNFYTDAINNELTSWNRSGEFFNANHIGRLFGATAGIILKAPFLPLMLMDYIIPDLSKTPVTKYYDLKSTMPAYYKYVNTIIAHLAVNMGMVESSDKKEAEMQNKNIASDMSYQEIFRGDDGQQALPEVFEKHGFDIFSIMSKRYLYNQIGLAENVKNLDDSIDEYRKTLGGTTFNWGKLSTGWMAGVQDAYNFVGIRIEKSIDNNESLSNSTGESQLAATLNSHASTAKETRFSLAGGTTGVGLVDALVGGLSGLASGLTNSIGVDSLSSIMMGSGRLDIPEVWKDSSFNKSYSFNIALRSPYGDPVSIMQSIYIPLALILAGALPRAAGKNAYDSPFLLSAYSKGMFAVPLGIIDSINIRRGAEQHGWNYQNLPTCIDISFTIKDLSPAMYMSIADSQSWADIIGQNSTFQHYLLTLSGVGTADRLLMSRNIKRRLKTILQVIKKNKLNPISWGFNLASTKIGRIYCAIRPTTDMADAVGKKFY